MQFTSDNKQKNKDLAGKKFVSNNRNFRNNNNKNRWAKLTEAQKKEFHEHYLKDKNIYDYHRILVLKYLFIYFDHSHNKVLSIREIYNSENLIKAFKENININKQEYIKNLDDKWIFMTDEDKKDYINLHNKLKAILKTNENNKFIEAIKEFDYKKIQSYELVSELDLFKKDVEICGESLEPIKLYYHYLLSDIKRSYKYKAIFLNLTNKYKNLLCNKIIRLYNRGDLKGSNYIDIPIINKKNKKNNNKKK